MPVSVTLKAAWATSEVSSHDAREGNENHRRSRGSSCQGRPSGDEGPCPTPWRRGPEAPTTPSQAGAWDGATVDHSAHGLFMRTPEIPAPWVGAACRAERFTTFRTICKWRWSIGFATVCIVVVEIAIPAGLRRCGRPAAL